MLRVLRVLSFVVAISTVCTVLLLIIFGFKDNSKADQFLQQHNILETIRNRIERTESQDTAIHPLVTQARLFAMRIDPPVPITETPKPPDKNETKNQGGRKSNTDIVITKPDPPPKRLDLLATVLYESAPEKSLALFQSGSKQRWFRSGETVNSYRIREIKNGYVLMSQAGRDPHEMWVPPKPHLASLIKGR